MDLIYTDKNRKDIDVLSDYELDEAFGKNENNFSLKISLSEHCMEHLSHRTVYFFYSEYHMHSDSSRL